MLAVTKLFIDTNLIIIPETVHKALVSKAFYSDNISVRYNSGANLNLKIYFHKVKSVTFQSRFLSSVHFTSLSMCLKVTYSTSLCRSFGVVLWEMLTGEVPYKDVDSSAIIWGVGNNSLHLPVPDSCPDSFKLLLRQCW